MFKEVGDESNATEDFIALRRYIAIMVSVIQKKQIQMLLAIKKGCRNNLWKVQISFFQLVINVKMTVIHETST